MSTPTGFEENTGAIPKRLRPIVEAIHHEEGTLLKIARDCVGF